MTHELTEFTSDYYDREYFADVRGKKFRRPNGSEDHWGYKNPEGEFLGAKPIAQAWDSIFRPETMLDAGAGRGVFVAYARDCDIKAEGFDFSEWAVNEGRYHRCSAEWLRVHDATKPWPYSDQGFDLIVCLDTLEHIYFDDLNAVIDEMYRVAKKWVFLEIATVDGVREKGYRLKRGEPIPLDRDARTWAGHVTVDTQEFWMEQLDREDWVPRRDLVNWFRALVDPKIIKNWRTIIIMERMED